MFNNFLCLPYNIVILFKIFMCLLIIIIIITLLLFFPVCMVYDCFKFEQEIMHLFSVCETTKINYEYFLYSLCHGALCHGFHEYSSIRWDR